MAHSAASDAGGQPGRVETQVNWTQQRPAPLISVSVAEAQPQETNLDDVFCDSNETSCKEAERKQSGNGARCQTDTSDSTCNVEGVRRDFLELINYNKLQCLFGGALLFAVANVAILSLSLRSENGLPAEQAQPLNAPLRPRSGYTLIGVLLVLSLLLACATVFSLIDFLNSNGLVDGQLAQLKNERVARSERRRNWSRLIKNCVQLLGTLLAVTIFLLPTATILFNCAPQESLHKEGDAKTSETLVAQEKLHKQLETTIGNKHRTNSYLATIIQISLGTICVAATCFVVHLFDAVSQFVRPNNRLLRTTIGLILALPFVIIGLLCCRHYLAASSTSSLLVAALLVLLTLFVGLLKRHLLTELVCELTFAGADELIEAKVSLEQQRQQQETLLLSVLPAYVAEQVKRNMVKKMTSNLDEDEQVCASQPQQDALFPAPSGGATKQANKPATNQNKPPATVAAPSDLLVTTCGTSSCATTAFLSSAAPHSGETLNCASGRATTSSCQQQQVGHLWPPQQPPSGNLHAAGQARRGFNELYIRTYNNVSLLYGDIVGFTRLCTLLSASQLVKALNDLFSHFDRLAERHKIMRIKILGDCYYGVSGIPEFAVMGAKKSRSSFVSGTSGGASGCGNVKKASQENHATNCVQMGLDMISYIKCLNIDKASGFVTAAAASASNAPQPTSSKPTGSSGGLTHSISASCSAAAASGEPTGSGRRQQPDGGCRSAGCNSPSALPLFELNMRIGIHTGHIHSGVIGLKKWQFDVWSNDVSIAMHCESSGVAGRVQVTEATVQHLHGAFTFEPTPQGATCDDFLANKAIRTYLIRERARGLLGTGTGTAQSLEAHQQGKRQPSTRSGGPNKLSFDGESDRKAGAGEQKLDDDKMRSVTVGTIREALLAGERPSANQANAYSLAIGHTDIFSWTLSFRDSTLERLYERVALPKWQFVAEQLSSFVLLVLALQFAVNLNLCNADTLKPIRVYLAGLAALMGSLLLASLLDLSRNKLEEPAQSVGGGSFVLGTERPAVAVQRQSKKWLGLAGKLVAPRRKLFGARRRLSQNSTSGNFGDKLKPSRTAASKQRNSLSSTASSILISLVILVQLYLVLGNFCRSVGGSRGEGGAGNGNGDSDMAWRANRTTSSARQTEAEPPNGAQLIATAIEHRQLSVILIVLALDLSVNLISYKFKCVLFALISLSQLLAVLILNPIPNAATLMGAAATSNSFGACRLFGPPDSTFGTDTQNNADSGRKTPSGTGLTGLQVVLWSSDTLLLAFVLLSFAFVRQLEYTNRVNFLWRKRLNVDHEELEYISGINKVLLENILPSHIVEHYLTQPVSAAAAAVERQAAQAEPQPVESNTNLALNCVRMSIGNLRNLNCSSASNELYHEQHESVAVMFASIPHFYEFYDESDISKQGLGCIALLNEIICDFDKLLLKNKFSRIEKIKTIGSTYMAAAGLRPCKLTWRSNSTSAQQTNPLPAASAGRLGRQAQLDGRCASTSSLANLLCRSNSGREKSNDEIAAQRRAQLFSQQKMNLICMIQFATSLVTTLNGINKHSFQVFKLRVGVNTGPVIAGIIGAQRPFYDIWGDCVNIASRMESLGEIGRIQVEERTARLLMECLCNETYLIERRGPIDVKGKGTMVTYFVDKREHPPPPPPQQPVGGNVPQQQQVVAAADEGSRRLSAAFEAGDEPERVAR